MKRSSHDYCLEMLRVMPAGAAQDAKWEDLKRLYSLVIVRLQDQEARDAVEWAALNESWRPSPARLMDIATELASKIPDVEQVYAEILRAAQEGLYCRTHPENPNIKLAGPPQFTHPLIERIVTCCGGWAYICSGEANWSEGLKKQVRSAHESAAAQWREEVKQQILLPVEQRDKRYFAPYRPVPLLAPSRELTSIPEPLKATEVIRMPPAIREMIQSALKPNVELEKAE